MRYVLDMNEEQANIVDKALELYTRLRIGQWRELLDLCVPLSDEDYCKKSDALIPVLLEARQIPYPELTSNPGHSFGVGKFEDADLAWEVHEVLRNKMAWTRHPEGGNGVNFYPPTSFRGNELAKCTAVPESADKDKSEKS